jgi:leucyl aminopeptidase
MTDVSFEAAVPIETRADALVAFAAMENGTPVWSSSANAIDAALDGELRSLAADARFTGKPAATALVPTLGKLPARRIVLAGIGSLGEIGEAVLSRAAGAAVRRARDAGAGDVAMAVPDENWVGDRSMAIEAIALGASLGLYRFDHYRGTASSERSDARDVRAIRIVDPEIAVDSARQALSRAKATAGAVELARDLGNEPASTLTPDSLADRARAVAESTGLTVDVLTVDDLESLGARAMLAVGGGSVNPPCLIRLGYRPDSAPSDGRVVGLVGKAITFDTGGYSIKPYEAMLEMKGDMAGGAAVLGIMSALRALACPVAVEATICAAENMISGTAFRPGDVIKGMNGVTMEILSTDAEGRLVLADGLVDTARRGATEMIDLATLTGAAVVALGDGTTALFASDDALANGLLAAAAQSGERMWRMPLIDELERKIEGDVADIKNTGGRAGGAITAALFLRHFSEGLPWAHLDIAGSARQNKAAALGPKGATGVGVRTLLTYLTGGGPPG